MKEEQPQTNTDTNTQPQTENKEQELTQNKEQEITITPVVSKPKPDFEFVESPHRIDYLEDGTQVTVVDVDPENPVTRIQSLCMECGEQGWTSFLLWDVAHFKKLVISSFMCPYCGEKNNSVQHGGSTEEKGVRYSLRVTKMEDFNRQIIKSDWSVIRIPDVDLEIPAETQKGTLSTIEGVLMQTYDSISHLQPLRRIEQPEAAEKLDEFLKKLKDLMELKAPFVFLLDDFSGNCFIENPFSPKEDPELIVEHYVRSQEQDWKLGIDTEAERQRKLREEKLLREMEQVQEKQEKERDDRAYDRQLDSELKGEFVRAPGSDSSSIQSSESLRVLSQTLSEVDIDERIISFVVPCSACPYEGEQRMVTINIPYFKDIVVMAFSCTNCGYKNSEIKTGGSISPKGKKLTLKVNNDVDLARDVLKSDTASLFIPEIELRVDYGSFGGRFTTVEGILNCIREDIAKNPFIVGDSSDQSAKERFKAFVNQIKSFQSGKEPFTLIIDDPVSNSYIQNIFWPEKDEQLVEEEYERSFQQNEDLGLNDIKTDNYIETNEPERVYGKPEEPVPEVELNPHHSKGKKD